MIPKSLSTLKSYYERNFSESEDLGLRLGCWLTLFAILKPLLLFKVPGSAFEQASFIAGAFSDAPAKRLFALLFIALFVLFNGYLRPYELERGSRWLLAGVTCICVYAYACYSPNWWAGQLHLYDRVAILGLGLATIRKPSWIGCFLIAVAVSVQQWAVVLPVDGEATNRAIFLDILLIYLAYTILRIWIKVPPFLEFGVPAGLILAHYWTAGIAKLAISPRFLEWLAADDLGNLVAAGFLSGWTCFWDSGSVVGVSNSASGLSPLLLLFALAVELLAPLSFGSVRIFQISATFRILLHLGIFLAIGDIFWNWVLLGIVLIVACSKVSTETRALLFSPKAAFFALLLCVCFSNQTSARRLGWFDSPVFIDFDYVVTGVSGQEYELPDGFAEPHDLALVQGVFHYTCEATPFITGVYGSVQRYDLYSILSSVTSLENVKEIINREGKIAYDPEKSQELDEFLRRLTDVDRLSLRDSFPGAFLGAIAPPHHIFTFPSRKLVWTGQEPPARVDVVFRRGWRKADGSIVLLDNRVVRSLYLKTGHTHSVR